MRRKIHIGDHVDDHIDDAGPERDLPDGLVASGDPAADPLGETAAGPDHGTREDHAHGRHRRHDTHREATPGEAQAGIVSALQARVAELEAQVGVEHDRYLRSVADFQNFRRRTEEENRRYAQFANEELIRALLPVLDNFERALASAESNKSFESLIGGVSLTHRQILDLLKRNGVEPIETEGQQFDPNFHEAVERVAESGEPESSIVQELQRGYIMNARVLRPSLVRVSGG